MLEASRKVAGSRHAEQGVPCEDVEWIRTGSQYTFAGLADGQSRKKYCVEGGKLALSAAADYLEAVNLPHILESRQWAEVQLELSQAIKMCLFREKGGMVSMQT